MTTSFTASEGEPQVVIYIAKFEISSYYEVHAAQSNRLKCYA